jgi:hypothetical protein
MKISKFIKNVSSWYLSLTVASLWCSKYLSLSRSRYKVFLSSSPETRVARNHWKREIANTQAKWMNMVRLVWGCTYQKWRFSIAIVKLPVALICIGYSGSKLFTLKSPGWNITFLLMKSNSWSWWVKTKRCVICVIVWNKSQLTRGVRIATQWSICTTCGSKCIYDHTMSHDILCHISIHMLHICTQLRTPNYCMISFCMFLCVMIFGKLRYFILFYSAPFYYILIYIYMALYVGKTRNIGTNEIPLGSKRCYGNCSVSATESWFSQRWKEKRRKGSKRYGDITGYWRRGQVMLLGICILVESYLCDGWPSDIWTGWIFVLTHLYICWIFVGPEKVQCCGRLGRQHLLHWHLMMHGTCQL